MAALHLTTENFRKEVLEYEGTAMVDFWASWCGPCQMVGPIIEEIAEEVKDAKICKVNVDEQPDIAYVHINEFSVQTGKEFAEEINALLKENFRGLILDLRNNGGGEVNAAVDVARVFVPSGPIVHVVSGNGKVDTKNATEAQLEIPLVVLVNGNTASASEILSGALKESGVATLVGTQTFGKGLVQGVYLFSDGTAMKITEAKYLTPKQNDINGVGIKPDVIVDLPEDAQVDTQLEKAIEILNQKMR